MNKKQLSEKIFAKKSCLCVGLDSDASKIPSHLKYSSHAVVEFNKHIIDATRDLCVAYKINTAFYECRGSKGWDDMCATLDYIGKEHFTIADAKRGDIGNTSSMYAQAFFEQMDFDSITVSPYMGSDSVKPFLNYQGRWAILLGLTSKAGSADVQQLDTNNGKVYEHVLKTSLQWGTTENMMYVVGATKAEQLKYIRNILPEHFLLIPGVGAQGGTVADVMENGRTANCDLLINSSRQILYASSGTNFAEAARKEAANLQQQMSNYF